jgi:hypothetical protein
VYTVLCLLASPASQQPVPFSAKFRNKETFLIVFFQRKSHIALQGLPAETRPQLFNQLSLRVSVPSLSWQMFEF